MSRALITLGLLITVGLYGRAGPLGLERLPGDNFHQRGLNSPQPASELLLDGGGQAGTGRVAMAGDNILQKVRNRVKLVP